MGGGGVPSTTALAAIAGRGHPLRSSASGVGDNHTTDAHPADRLPSRCPAPEPPPYATPGLRRHRYLRLSKRRRTGQRTTRSSSNLAIVSRPARLGLSDLLRRSRRSSRPTLPSRKHRTDRRRRNRPPLRLHPGTPLPTPPRRNSRPDRRPNPLAHPTPVPHHHRPLPPPTQTGQRGRPRLLTRHPTGLGPSRHDQLRRN